MELKTKADLIATVAERWKHQYYYASQGWSRVNLDHTAQEIYHQLLGLSDGATEKDVVGIVGNTSWTENLCDECGQDVEVVVMLGDEPDYESSTAYVCPGCLRKAIMLVENAS